MAEPLSALKSAGFDDQEISAWSAEKRGALTAAGFQDHEIEAYFSGGVTVPPDVPRPLAERVASEQVTLGMVANTAWNDLKKLADSIKSGLTLGADVIEGKAILPSSGAVPGSVPFGDPDSAGERVADAALLIATGSMPMWRTVKGALGGRVEQIGTLPKSQDFVDAARVVGDTRMPVQEKMLDLYKENGIHPSETALSAQNDPVVAQKLLSSDRLDKPSAPRTTEEPTPPQKTPNYLQVAIEDAFAREPDIARDVAAGLFSKEPRNYTPQELARGITDLSVPGGPMADLLAKAERDIANGATPEFAISNFLDSVQSRLKTESLRNFMQERSPLREHASVDTTAASGGKPPEPPEPPKPPKPPEPGSFEEAQAKVLSKVSVGDREAGKYSWSKLYTQTIDDLHPLKAVSEDAYEMARLTRGQFGKAEHFIEHGTFDFNSYKTNGKPLREIMEPIKDDLDGFRAFLTSKRALEIEATGRKSGIDLAAAERVASDGEARFGKAAGDLLDYQNNLLKYLRDAGVLSDKAFGAMVQASESYIPFYRVFFPEKPSPSSKGFGPGNPVKALEGSDRGIIDPLESIIKNTYAYVSVAERNAVGIKLIDALKEQGFKAATKTPKYEGGEAKLVDYLKQNGVHDAEALVDFVKASAADEGTAISAWRGGKREAVETNDAELVKAFRGMDEQSVTMVTKVLAVPAKTMRAGAVLTPDFMVRNLIRDFVTAIVNSKGLFSPIDTVKGVAGVITKDADFMNWLKAGGANSTFVALDRRYMQESLASLTKETGLGNRAWNVLTNPLAPLRMMSELMENATRLGEFKKVAGTDLGKEALQGAAFAAREVTLDFARIGARLRAWNMITTFANAHIQGVDRTVRAFKDRPVNTIAKVAGGITLPSVYLWWVNHGDPRYEELPSWQKDLFWIILTDKWEPMSPADAAGKPAHLVRGQGGKTEFNNGSIWRIPKPHELGLIFGSGVERALSATVGRDPEAFKNFGKSVVSTFAPTVIPTAVQPVIEQYANRSTFTDRTLIPADVEKHLPEYQYTPYTTELAKSLGQIFSAFPGMREASVEQGNVAGPAARALTTPILIENYVRSWTGGLGMYALQAADLSLRKAGVLPDPITPTPTLADIPFVRAFAVRYPSATTESIQRFYDEHGRNKRYFDTWMAKAQEGDTTALEHIQKAGGPQMFLQLDEIRSTLTHHSKLIRDIYKHPQMEAAEKRQLIDSLYFNMIQLGQGGRQILKQSTEALAPQ